MTETESRLELTDVVGQKWRATLGPERFELRGDEGAAIAIGRDEANERIHVRHSIGSKPMLHLRQDDRTHGFRLSDEEFRAIGTWLGRELTTKRAVTSFSFVAILCGVLWLLVSMPVVAVEGEPPQAHWAGLIVGAIALGSGLAARFRPHRGVLVADAAWCTGAAIDTGWKVSLGESAGLWLIGAALLLALAYGQIRLFFLIGELPGERSLGQPSG
jgi:hypothetical protein